MEAPVPSQPCLVLIRAIQHEAPSLALKITTDSRTKTRPQATLSDRLPEPRVRRELELLYAPLISRQLQSEALFHLLPLPLRRGSVHSLVNITLLLKVNGLLEWAYLGLKMQ